MTLAALQATGATNPVEVAIGALLGLVLSTGFLLALFVGFLVWSTWALLPRMFSKYAALGWPIQVGYYAILVGGSVTILAKAGKYAVRGLRRWN